MFNDWNRNVRNINEFKENGRAGTKIIGDNSAIPFINGFNFDSMEDVFKLSNPKFNIYGDNISIEFEKNK